jgi:DNA-directed RNA polymerase subunit RPC12/RpoP
VPKKLVTDKLPGEQQVTTLKKCEYCGSTGSPLREGLGLVWLAVVMWLVPIVFLSFGFWPFFLIPALAVSIWAYLGYRLRCPDCGKNWRNKHLSS